MELKDPCGSLQLVFKLGKCISPLGGGLLLHGLCNLFKTTFFGFSSLFSLKWDKKTFCVPQPIVSKDCGSCRSQGAKATEAIGESRDTKVNVPIEEYRALVAKASPPFGTYLKM